MLQVSDRWKSLIGCLQWMLGILSDRIDIKRGYGRIMDLDDANLIRLIVLEAFSA